MIRKFKKYLESKKEDFEFDFLDEEDEMEGYYYWLTYKDNHIVLRKIQLVKSVGVTYDYKDLLGDMLTSSIYDSIEFDLTTDEIVNDPEMGGLSYLFTNLNNNRFKEFYTYYFKERFDKNILNDMNKDGLIKEKMHTRKVRDFGWGHYDDYSSSSAWDDWGTTT